MPGVKGIPASAISAASAAMRHHGYWRRQNCLLACHGEGRRRHAPARHGEFAHAVHRRGADDRSGIIGKDAGQHRQVAREIAHGAGEVADRLLAFGDAAEIAHGRSVSPRRGQRKAGWAAFRMYLETSSFAAMTMPPALDNSEQRGLGLVIVSQSRSHQGRVTERQDVGHDGD